MWLYNSLIIIVCLANVILISNDDRVYVNREEDLTKKKFAIDSRKVYLIVIFIPVFFISALRSVNIGNDTDTYHQLYTASAYMNWSDFLKVNKLRWEKGFLLLNKVLSNISANPQLIVAITALVSLFLVFRFIYKYSERPALSIFLFITMRFYFFFMSNIRQSLAIAIILLSYDYIRKRRLVPFVICVLIASQFHNTAIVFLLAYLLEKLQNNKMVAFSLFIGTFIVFLSFNPFMNLILKIAPLKYSNYINTSYFQEATNVANITNFLVALTLLIFTLSMKYNKKKKIENKTQEINKKSISLNFLVISVCCAFLAIKFGMFSRVQHYFYIFSIVTIPNIISSIKDAKKKTTAIYFIIVCFFLYHMIILLYRPEWQHVYPYELFF